MPDSMIHMILAHKVNQEGSSLFFLGNIAPDGVRGRYVKDITHFRNLNEREPALIDLAKKTSGDFAEGVLLHLFFDWKWDGMVLQKFIDKTGGDWFASYRNEILHAGSYAFYHLDWAKKIWQDIENLDMNSYGETPQATNEDVKNLMIRKHTWYKENRIDQSSAFPPDLIEDFTTQVSEEYVEWRESR